jgi:DNA-binding MarR family transcriptional regulator
MFQSKEGHQNMTDYFEKTYWHKPDSIRQMFIKEWNSGTPSKQIAEIFGLASPDMVRNITKILVKHGYTIRRRNNRKKVKKDV